MKSLDINTASTNFGAYNSRQFLIEFTGGSFTESLQGTTTHKVIVPYGSLSKKLKTIQRLGSKVVNVSIHPQIEVLKVNPENAAPEQINEHILEVHHEISPKKSPKKSVEQSIAKIVESEVVEVAEITSETFPEPILQTISETTSKEVSDVNSEAVSAEPPQVVAAKKKKAISESTAKPKKAKAPTKASTKGSNEVGQTESSTQVLEPIAIAEPIAEPITVSEQVLEPDPEIVVETISAVIPEISLKPIPEEILPTLLQNEAQELILPLAKAKAPRNSSKSGHGFNKSKGDAKSPRSPK